ncbi:nuclear transport factor 2 family protein [Parvibium lacunae]|uniref:Nuclear transport factor 2 family protein n=1 Tax=Parvibium lacunae TaxID=1888893 RepID=A0A368L1Z5_9BURK|nr:nuclear transport factor 2 family protein [Parvibium lacunae]RCS57132.1 nuclear transport factor 2 family protein [Parvibium lacunae]
MTDFSPALTKLQQFFVTLSPDSVLQLRDLYCADAYFKDPFNEVREIESIVALFKHMFVQVEAPRFIVLETVLQGSAAFLVWEFRFRMRRWNSTEQSVRGSSHIKFAPDGKVSYHRDYWDVAEELYEKLPLLGSLMRGLKAAARR